MSVFARISKKSAKVIRIDDESVKVYRLTGKVILSSGKLVQRAMEHIAVLFEDTSRDSAVEIVQDESGAYCRKVAPVSLEMAQMRNARRDSAWSALAELLDRNEAPSALVAIIRDTYRDEFKDESDEDILNSFSLDQLAETLETVLEVNDILKKLKGVVPGLQSKLQGTAPEENEEAGVRE
jgi:hypothetical protein